VSSTLGPSAARPPNGDYTVVMAEETNRTRLLRAFYTTLSRHWGSQHWWPARTRFEVIVGAYLTQNTAWTNVERAMRELRRARVLSVAGIRRTPLPELEQMIRSAGYFRQKAARLKRFVQYLDTHYGGSLDRMFARPTYDLRQELLALNGIGPETADSILLYAGNHDVFVVDAYTRRILDRHAILPANAAYEEIRELFEAALNDLPATECRVSPENSSGAAHLPSAVSRAPRSTIAQTYSEMHALLVGVGKRYCWKKRANCEECPLAQFLPR
jgi:endonuclease III related protein